MTRKILFVLLLVVSALTASAQECRLTGSVIDKDTKEKMEPPCSYFARTART